MKRLAPLVLLITFLFAGCQAKNYTPELPLTFEQKATVTSGDFSFDCEICKTDEKVRVTVLSTNASGMVMTCDGEKLGFVFGDYAHSVNCAQFERSNTAVVIYETVRYLTETENIEAEKTESGYRYNGKISLGDFVLTQNDDNTLGTLTVRSADYKIEFK